MPKGVKFYYIYKSLAHPESGGYVQPFTLQERLMHVKEAEQRIDGEIPWLCDTIGNDVMHTLGNAPTSEFVIDPEGNIVRKRAWGNVQDLRKDLEGLVGAVENPTQADDLNLKIAPAPKLAAKGVVKRIKVPSGMKPLVARPDAVGLVANIANPSQTSTPYYAKLRADTEQSLLKRGKGKLYLGFHLDPIHRVHWNNLTKPIHVKIESPDGVEMPESLDGPKVDVESDADPREFLVDVSGWSSDEPLHVIVRYFACSDEPAFCVPVTQRYTIHRKLDIDSGWVRGRVDPTGGFRPTRPKIAAGRVVRIDAQAHKLTIRRDDEQTLEFIIDSDTRFHMDGKRRPLGDLKTDVKVRVEFFVRDEGPLARDLRAKAGEPKEKVVPSTDSR